MVCGGGCFAQTFLLLWQLCVGWFGPIVCSACLRCAFVQLCICAFVHLYICAFVHLSICTFVHICAFVLLER